ncbi:MAG: NAD(P) transhydrogenase subunit alpha [Spirochaetaceae bacterium]|nr:MAG: NAD(P) transhydrogenase subunit alpha [Spirochaetaceae bacterium]
MTIGVIRERLAGETRVALVPAHVPDVKKLGARVLVESGAGVAAGYLDEQYAEKGAEILPDRAAVLAATDLLVAVRSGAAAGEDAPTDLEALPEGAAVVAMMDPWREHESFRVLSGRRQRAFALELLPRITRAQSMDVLSSQANLAGYRAVLLAATELPRMFPMLMTAAGTVVPARVLVVGVGVAGLQAIATARRLGAIVSAYDIRPAVREQVESLGARFVEMELQTGDAESGGGYAREMDEEFYRRQRELMRSVVAEQHVIITTAAIPGRKAPVLVTEEMVRGMAPGSVIVDLAAERGGNCEPTRVDEVVSVPVAAGADSGAGSGAGSVRILGPSNIVAGLAYHASQLFSKNMVTFLATILREGALRIDRKDEIIAATMIMEDGACPDRERASVLGVPHGGAGGEA